METINAKPGEHFYMFLERVLEKANDSDRQYVAKHNDREVIVSPNSNINALADTWQRGGIKWSK